jgi:hypothetical protein
MPALVMEKKVHLHWTILKRDCKILRLGRESQHDLVQKALRRRNHERRTP